MEDRRLLDENNLYPPGVENDSNFELDEKWKRSTNSPKRKSIEKPATRRSKSTSRSRERKTRSRSRDRRRSRSRSNDRRIRRPNFRFGRGGGGGDRDFKDKRRSRERRDMRNDRGRSRERSRDRSRGRDNSRDRGRFRRGNRRSPTSPPQRQRREWSPKKIAPAPHNQMTNQVPAPPVVSQPQVYPPPHMFNDAYNNYAGGVQYQNQQQSYNAYDYSSAPPPPSFGPNYPPPPPVLSQQPIPPGDEFPAPPNWNVPPPQMINTQQQPLLSVPVQQITSEEDKLKRDAAVAQEVQNQRATLRKQREDYRRRASALKRELKTLKEQRNDLSSGNEPPSPTTKGFIKENDRLQSQIQNKLNTIENVIDMLSGIIGKESDERQTTPIKTKKKKTTSESNDSSPEVLKTKLIESMHKSKRSDTTKIDKDNIKFNNDIKIRNDEKSNKIEEEIKIEAPPAPIIQKKINYIHYDPEMHWCKECDVFPKTAKDYLNHLHSREHIDIQKNIESPWHSTTNTDEMPSYPNAPTKRTPIRGLQFFVPSTAWFCKLCSIWMGDLHCASLHLKSQVHAEKSNEYMEQNPHFEIDWMADRQKAYENYRDNIPQAPMPPSLIPTPVPPIEKSNIFEGIPLQINNQLNVSKSADILSDSKEEKKLKKKKNKKGHDDKKDKKKKKKSKKRRRTTSSSSSSSEDSSDSDSDKESFKLDESNDKSNSIRVAMRNLLKTTQQKQEQEKQDEIGRWTIVQTTSQQTGQPLPVPSPKSIDTIETKKKDELIMSQWATPEPIISASEKKLLEDLKGRLKKKSVSDRDDNLDDKDIRMGRQKIKEREREKDRENFKEKENNRSCDDSRDRNKERDRQKSRERETFDRRGADRRRRSRSRNRRNSPVRRTYRGRRSFSRSRSRTRIIEKAVINYPPEPKPRPEKKIKSNRGNDDDPDRKRSPMVRKPLTLTAPGGKKLPFIGRMPVFKKQSISEDGDKKDELSSEETTDGIEPPPPPPPYMMDGHDMHSVMMEDDDDLMPDPAQLMAIMATAPPPPPRMPMPHQEEVLPPGIDEADADLVPKPISDAPRPRKGPLPKDFQDALNIIFPGERKPDQELPMNKPNETHKIIDQTEITTEIPMVIADDLSQQSLDMMYGAYAAATGVGYTGSAQLYGMYDPLAPVEIPEIVPPPPPVYQEVNGNQSPIVHQVEIPEVVIEETKKEIREELDDLAMLGIDADDLAAQCM